MSDAGVATGETSDGRQATDAVDWSEVGPGSEFAAEHGEGPIARAVREERERGAAQRAEQDRTIKALEAQVAELTETVDTLAATEPSADPWGPQSAWGQRLQQARDLGDQQTIRDLYAQREFDVESAKAAEWGQQQEAALFDRPEVVEHDAKIAAAREAGDDDLAAALDADRRAVALRAQDAEAAKAAQHALEVDIAKQQITHGQVPPEVAQAAETDETILRLRAKLQALDGESGDAADKASQIGRRTALEQAIADRLVEMVAPTISDFTPRQPMRPDGVDSAQSAQAEYAAAEAAGDVEGMIAAQNRIAREWRERQQARR